MVSYIVYSIMILILPLLLMGFLQKIKAKLQNRIGAPLLQPFFNVLKLWNKTQILSEDASFLFRFGILLNFCIATYLILSVPWLNFSPMIMGLDLFLLVYLLAAARFFNILSALDTGSPFGAFSGSREAALSFLVEPSLVLCLLAPGLLINSNVMSEMFAFKTAVNSDNPAVWIFASLGLFLTALVELSRMPVDDPNTHLELTMVHEAMIIEASGRNLALCEYSYALKLTLFFGLSVQCFLHAVSAFLPSNEWLTLFFSVIGMFFLAAVLAMLETVLVKLKWTKCPDFIAYALTMGMFACIVALRGRT